jgi:hypothetical protein
MKTKTHRMMFLEEDNGSNPPGGSPPASPPATPPATPPQDWKTALPPELQSNPTIQKYTDISGLAKSHVELASKLGQPHVPIPQDGWTPEQWNDFHTKLGRPESPDKYTLPKPQLPEGMNYDEGMEKWFREKAHSAGIPQRQAEKMYAEYLDFSLAQATAATTAQAEAQANAQAAAAKVVADLQKEWGGEYKAKLDGAQQAIKFLGGDELAAHLNETGAGNDPKFIRMFAKLGEMFAEDRLKTGEGFRIAQAGFKAPSDALAELGTLKADPNFTRVLLDKAAPGNREAKQRWDNLMKAAYPQES